MDVTSSIRLCFSMRKSTLPPYPDENDKERKLSFWPFAQRLIDQTWSIAKVFFSSMLRLLRFRLYDCR